MDLNVWAIIQALRGKRTPEYEVPQDPAEKAKVGAEELAQYLPEPVMPHQAIKEDRRRKAMIDALLKE